MAATARRRNAAAAPADHAEQVTRAAGDPGAAARLWLGAQQRVAARAAHEIKNPLNGASINLQLVHSRAGHDGVAAAALAPFAEAALAELERSIELIEALLALARPVGHPVDFGSALRPIVRLLAAVAAADGGSLLFEATGEGDGAAGTAPSGDAVRGAVAAVLEAAVGGGAEVRCTVAHAGGRAEVRVRREPAAFEVPPEVRELIVGAGVGFEGESDEVTLSFSAE